MHRGPNVLLLVALLASPRLVSADSIDDAEAKRRGVPVAQVIAERELATAQGKNAALEEQIADLQKQLDALRKGTPATVAAGPQESYRIQLNRPPVKGSVYEAHYIFNYSSMGILGKPGAEPKIIDDSFKGDVTGKFTVKDVHNGRATSFSLLAHSFVVNDKDVFPAEQLFLIEPHEQVMYYQTTGFDTFPDIGRRGLDQIFLNILSTEPNDDDAYGSKAPHKVNDEWPINAKLALPELQYRTVLKFNPDKITGKTKLAGIETVGDIKVFRIIVSMDMTDFKTRDPHAGYTVTTSTLHMTFTRLVPMDPQLPVLHEVMEYAGLLSEKTGTGEQFDIKMHTTRTSDVTPTLQPK